MEVQGFAGFGLENGGSAIASFGSMKIKIKCCLVVMWPLPHTIESRLMIFTKVQSAQMVKITENQDCVKYIIPITTVHLFLTQMDITCHHQPVEIITRKIKLSISPQETYELFVNKFGQWWPKEYTWSQDKLLNIIIEPKPNGRCYEESPNGFLCQFGSILKINPELILKSLGK